MSDQVPVLRGVKRRIFLLMSDGLPHTKKELMPCLNDDLSSPSNLKHHILHLRKWLRPQGMDILCQYVNKRIHYRMVRLISPVE